MATVKVSVVGLGRLGTSYGMALRALSQKPEARHQFEVTGCDRSSGRVRTAAKMGALDHEGGNFQSAVEGADLVFFAPPYGEAEQTLEIIGKSMKPGAVVMDASPLKQPSLKWADKYFRRDDDGGVSVYLVGVTPVINPEYLGEPDDSPNAARADLFEGGSMIISPAAHCPAEAVKLVTDLTEIMQLRAHFVDPIEHDGMVAGTEALPLLLQLGLFQALSGSKAWGDVQWISNPAFFLSTYRLMQIDPESAAEEIGHNRDNALRYLDALMERLTALRDVLKTGDQSLLAENFDEATRKYTQWQEARLKNKWEGDLETPTEGRAFNLLGGLGGLIPRMGGRDKKKKQ
ncbi:MAG: prephenate dehydrogenase [Anaerolinea sp.]|nr:prephenate dehydrogenase [Anaerolinea sp.]MCC6976551.1 prephenate dehydrogenase [Anaerolineae bacterium]CAG0992994.1 Cyclohexadienyl dehydrogenase [Anaerolineae bacterium]